MTRHARRSSRRIDTSSPALAALLAASLVALFSGCGGGDEGPGKCEETTSTGIDKVAVASLNDQVGTAQAKYGFDGSGGEKRFPFQLTNIASAVSAAPLLVTKVTLTEVDGDGNLVGSPAFSCEGPGGAACEAKDFAAVIPSGYNDTACKPDGAKTGVGFEIVYSPPASSSARKATLTLELSGDPNTKSISVVFETTLGEPRLKLDNTQLSFGTVKAGAKPSSLKVKMRSIGTAPVKIEKIALFSNTAPPITVAIAGITTPVDLKTPYAGTPELSIGPGKTVELTVTLGSLPAEEKVGATLVVTSNSESGEEKVLIDANSSGPCLKPSPSSVDFGEVGVGTPKTIEVLLDGCGTEPVTVEEIALKSGSSADLQLDFTTGSFTDGKAPTKADPLVVQPNGQESFRVRCTPSALGSDSVGTIVLKSKEMDDRELSVDCKPAKLKCPTACFNATPGLTVVPQTQLTLDAACSAAGPGHVIDKYAWTVKQPDGSQATFTPNNKVKKVNLLPNVAGTYSVTLEVADEVGTQGCGPVTKDIEVVPDNKLHIELTWITPGDKDKTDDKGADLDMHLAHPKASDVSGQKDLDGNGVPDPWYAACYDAFSLNKTPKWGDLFDVADNPALDLDDNDGWGPENMSIPIPETDTWYSIGVYCWDDGGFGASKPRVRIYIDKELIVDRIGPSLKEGDMWCVGEVSYDPLATSKNAKAKLFRKCKGADATGNLVTPKYPPADPSKTFGC